MSDQTPVPQSSVGPDTVSPTPGSDGTITTASASAANPAPAEKPVRKRRSWRRRILITLSVLLILAAGSRLLVHFLLPVVLQKVAASYDLNCTYERLELSTLGGDAALWHLKITPKSGGDSIVEADYVRGNISTLNLLRGRLVVWRAEADGTRMLIDREADGRIPLLDKFLNPSGASTAASAAPAPGTNDPTAPLSLESPLRIDALRVSRVQARVRDRSVTPNLDADVTMTFRLSDVGSPERPTRFELEVIADPLMDSLLVEGVGRSTPTSLEADVTVALRGLHPKPAAGYLLPLGLKPVADTINAFGKAHIALATKPIGGANVGGTVSFRNVQAIVDGQEWAGVDHIDLDVKQITGASAEFGTLLLTNARASAYRTESGGLRVAGLELAAPANVAPAPPVTPTTTEAATGKWPNYAVAMDAFRVRGSSLTFVDRFMSPAAQLAVKVQDFSVTNIVIDPSRLDSAMQMSALIAIPGIVDQINLQGTAAPFAGNKSFALQCTATRIRLDAAKSYLDQLQLESQLDHASFTGKLQGSLTIAEDGQLMVNAAVDDLNFSDAENLFSMKKIALGGVAFNPATGAVRITSLEFVGPSLSITRDRTGEVAALGLRTNFLRKDGQKKTAGGRSPASEAPADPDTSTSADASSRPAGLPSSADTSRAGDSSSSSESPAASRLPDASRAPAPAGVAKVALPRIEIGSFVWKGTGLVFIDETTTPATTFHTADAGFELKNLLFDLQSDVAGTPGTFTAHLLAPGLAGELRAEGTITPAPSSIALDMNVTGSELNAMDLAPYLRPLGIEPTLARGSVALRMMASARADEGGLSGEIKVRDLLYADGAQPLVALNSMTLAGRWADGELLMSDITLDAPRASLTRNKNGTIEAAGIRIVPATQPVASAPSAGAEQLPDRTASPAVARSTDILPPMPVIVSLKKLSVADAQITLNDNAVVPALDTRVTATVDVNELTLGKRADDATFHIAAKIGNAVDEAILTGTLKTTPSAPGIHVHVTARGLRAGGLEAYIPEGVAVNLRDGQFKTTLDAAVSTHEAGGYAGNISLRDLDFRDGDARLFALDSFTIRASRLDIKQAITIDEISLRGLESAVTLTSEGIDAAGVRLVGTSNAQVQPDLEAAEQEPSSTQQTSSVADAVVVAAGPEAVTDVTDLVAAARRALPLMTLEKLDLQVRSFSITDARRPASAPLVVSDLTFINSARIELGGPGAESNPPVQLLLSTRLSPVVDAMQVKLIASPFLVQPTLKVDVLASGIRGTGVTALIPEVTDLIDGSSLTEGEFRTAIELSVSYGRRGPRDVDLSRGFSCDLAVRPLEYRGQPGGDILGGIQEIRTDGVKVDPLTGSVHVKTLDITKPIGRFTRESDGLHAFGFVIPLPAVAAADGSTEAPATQPTDAAIAPAETPVPTPPPANQPDPATPASASTSEMRMDRLLISDIDVVIEDRTTQPTTIVPLTSLDVDVRDVSTRALIEPRPIRFSLLVGAGEVPLPRKRVGQSGGPAPADDTSGTEASADFTEMRELFSQVTASGSVALYPSPNGYIKTSVNGFEIAGLRGLAKQAGVTIGGGIFDESTDIRLKPGGHIDTRSKLVLTDLSVTEPPDGIIRRTLGMPAPLDIILFGLQDPDGSITIPSLSIPLEDGQLDIGAVAGSAALQLVPVFATATASAPLKMAGGVGSMLGLGAKAQDTAPVTFAFLPGYTALTEPASTELKRLIERLKDDKTLELTIRHELGGGDIARARIRANPPATEAKDLAEKMRLQRQILLAERAAIAGQAGGELATDALGNGRATRDRLRAVDREIAQTDDAMDQLYDLLRPGADRQSDRRTRAACIDIAKQRQAFVRQALLASGITGVGARIHESNPKYTDEQGSAGGRVVITFVAKKRS